MLCMLQVALFRLRALDASEEDFHKKLSKTLSWGWIFPTSINAAWLTGAQLTYSNFNMPLIFRRFVSSRHGRLRLVDLIDSVILM